MTNKQVLYFLCIVMKNTMSQIVYNNELDLPNPDANNANLKNMLDTMGPHVQLVYTGDPKSGYILYQKLPPNNIPDTVQYNNDNTNKVVIRSECNQCVYPEGCCQNRCPECLRYGNILLSHGYKVNYPYSPENNSPVNAQNQANIDAQLNPQINQEASFLINPSMNLQMDPSQNQLNLQTNQQMSQQVYPQNSQINSLISAMNPQISAMNSQMFSPVNAPINFPNTLEPSNTLQLSNTNTKTQNPTLITDKVIRRPIPTTIYPAVNPNDESETEVIKKNKVKNVLQHEKMNSTVTTNNQTNTLTHTLYTVSNTTSNPKIDATTANGVPVIIIYNNEPTQAEDLDYPVGEVEKEVEEVSPNKPIQGKTKNKYHQGKTNLNPKLVHAEAEYYEDDEESHQLSTYAKNTNHIKYDPYIMVRRTIKNRLPESEILFSRMKDLKLKRAMLPDRKTVLSL